MGVWAVHVSSNKLWSYLVMVSFGHGSIWASTKKIQQKNEAHSDTPKPAQPAHLTSLYIVTSFLGRDNWLVQGTSSSSKVCFLKNVKMPGCPMGEEGPNSGQKIYEYYIMVMLNSGLRSIFM